MALINFVLQNWDSIILILAIATVLIIFYYKGEKKIFYRILYALITEAEAQYGGKTGALKKAAVISYIYGMIPGILKIFITQTRLENWIEEVLIYAKETWALNAGIQMYIAGPEPEPDTDPEEPDRPGEPYL